MFHLLDDFQQSGLSRLDFCEQKKIAVAKFYYWQKKLRDQSSDTPNGFIRLSSRKGHGSVEPMTPIVLQYPNGVSLQLPAGTSISVLRTLLCLV